MFNKVLAVLLVILALLMMAVPVLAAPAMQEVGIDAPGLGVLAFVLDAFFGLVPVVAVTAPLIAMLVNAGKRKGWIKAGQAGLWSGGLNFLAWVLIGIATYLGYEEAANSIVEGLILIVPVALTFFASFGATKGAYRVSEALGVSLKEALPEPRDLPQAIPVTGLMAEN